MIVLCPSDGTVCFSVYLIVIDVESIASLQNALYGISINVPFGTARALTAWMASICSRKVSPLDRPAWEISKPYPRKSHLKPLPVATSLGDTQNSSF